MDTMDMSDGRELVAALHAIERQRNAVWHAAGADVEKLYAGDQDEITRLEAVDTEAIRLHVQVITLRGMLRWTFGVTVDVLDAAAECIIDSEYRNRQALATADQRQALSAVCRAAMERADTDGEREYWAGRFAALSAGWGA